ncbi:extensin-3 [Phalaenopsis equestris]|uniref:extensin-3 n=1 Tax=Phalaenopsis equestris TaxID=78828 RepID=UPI0009E57F1D|nr:extensin-3 [Phalaenopsis equestris]
MATPRPSSPATRPLEIEITVVSAKHLKNVNWRHGDLKPYAVAYLDPERRSATKPDDAGSTRPVWNERLVLPLPPSLHHGSPLFLTLDIFHSKPSETPKPLVGTARSPLSDLIDLEDPSGTPTPIRSLELQRPSGRNQGKIRIKLAIRERPCAPEPNYSIPHPPPSSYYYSAPLPPLRNYRSFPSPSPYNHAIPPPPSQYPYGNYSDPYSGYYPPASAYYSAPPAPAAVALPARPSYYDRASSYGLGPSAPVDYSSVASYEQKQKGGNMGFGAGLAVGAVAGSLGALALEEGLKHEEGKITERVESDLATREDYNDYRSDY